MSNTIAINVALIPDKTVTARAIALNARLRKNYPSGFALGSDRLVHITLAQAFVLEKDVEAIWQLVKGVHLEGKLKVEGFDFFPRQDGLGSSGWDLNRPPWLLSAQQQVESLLRPFTQADGDGNAFFRGPGENDIPESTIKYVRQFFTAHSGKHFNPHVTLGRAREDFLRAVRDEPLVPFEFSVEQLGIFQLGSHGTCRRVLRSLNLPQPK